MACTVLEPRGTVASVIRCTVACWEVLGTPPSSRRLETRDVSNSETAMDDARVIVPVAVRACCVGAAGQ